jgi:hypothetical protein
MKTFGTITAAAMLLQSSQIQASPIEARQLSAVLDLAGLLLSFLGFADTFFPDAPTLW